MKDSKNSILEFWFRETKPAQWFQKNSAFDDLIRSRFEGDLELAEKGIFDAWMDDADGCLALVILLDQFPRNMYRGSSQAFDHDAQARRVTLHALNKHFDQMLEIDQKAFLYLPLEHSEDLTDQNRAVALFEMLKDKNPIYYNYAVRHREIIIRFGRFPHRNEALGRPNTAEEAHYLAEPDVGF